jgi:phytoene/squalene synthetase
MNNTTSSQSLAPSITKAASKQTYYTIRFLADHERVADAYRAYAYFRWLDDALDGPILPYQDSPVTHESVTFLERQKSLLEKCYQGEPIRDATLEEQMLIELVRHDREKNSGLQSYLRNMMQVMDLDASRRGRLISQFELGEYTRYLATAVTEAMHYFIGHCCYSPRDETRYLAVTGAHITHMLRDTFDDLQAGYYNIPREILEATHIQPQDIQSTAYRAWVRSRVQQARKCFQAGREYLARVQNPRCRLAGLAYTARFEWLLDTIEQENYVLRPEYTERKRFGTELRMGVSVLAALTGVRERKPLSRAALS